MTKRPVAKRPTGRERLGELELAAWQSFLHAHDAVMGALDAELREQHQINLRDYDVLLRLARAEGEMLPMTELAKRVLMSPSGLTRAVDRLTERGLIRRDRHSADSRVVHAVLTQAGLHRVRRATVTHLDGIRRHFTGRLSSEQLRHVAEALGEISGPHRPH